VDVIQYGDVPDPVAGLDIWVRRGWRGLKLEMPHWCGADVAGEIVEVGRNVIGWRVGQRVVADPGFNLFEDEYTRNGRDSLSPGYHVLGEHRRGGAADFISLGASSLVEMPADWNFPEAAAPLLVSVTAWRMLIDQARLRAGESVLMVGAGGGVNSMSIQIAKLAGATVYVVAGNRLKAEKAKELGADVVLDRSQMDWGREIFKLTGGRGVEVVVDNVGQATLSTSMRAAARGGRIVMVGNTSGPRAQIDIRFIFGKQISLIGSTMGSHQDFRTVTSLLWAGKIRPVIDRVMPLSEGRTAYELMERGEQFGKIVLVP
jgi:NADPH:quinone reductase-like Zn-dependent oxidoreductase